MKVDYFWKLIENIDQDALDAGKEEAAVSPLVNALSSLTVDEIESFDENLSRVLYAIDGEEFADSAGEAGNSTDGFLYCRCYVVARGRKFYENVLKDPSAMPNKMGQWLEPLLFAAPQAWGTVTGNDPEEWNFTPSFSYETGSNKSLWGFGSDTTETTTTYRPDFVEPNLQRAVAMAGHQFKRGEYENVITLLEPHEKSLSKKQLKILNDARSHSSIAK